MDVVKSKEIEVVSVQNAATSLGEQYEAKDITIMNPPETYKNKIVKVRQANDVSRSIWPIKTIWGGRILAYLASMIKEEDPDNKMYSIPLTSLAREAGRQRDGAFLREIDETTTMIIQTVIMLRNKDDEGDIEKFSPLSYCHIKMSEGVIEAQFSPKMKPFYTDLKDNYTLYPRQEFLQLRSLYSQRLYELLMSWHNIKSGQKEIPLQDLHEKLQTMQSQQKNFGEFNRRVLQPALNEIKNTTSLFVTAIPQRENEASKTSKVKSVLFVFDEEQVRKQENDIYVRLQKLSYECYQTQKKNGTIPCRPKSHPKCEYCMTRGAMYAILSDRAQKCKTEYLSKNLPCKCDKRTVLCKFCIKNHIAENVTKDFEQQNINFETGN